MHPNPAFRDATDALNLAFARKRGFGVLTVAGPDGPLASHIPFVLSEDGATAAFHLVRSNPIVKVLSEDAGALIVVSGPDAYVSPDWYGDIPDQVPTWNYVAVHLRGAARLLSREQLRPHLTAASSEFETRLSPKKPWTLDKMSADQLERMERMIVPAEMTIAKVEGTWKLNQNKPQEARAGAEAAIEAGHVGSEPASAIARLMREM
ncbi:MAG: FMN-binding negative transcriptional regulator [Pseudomonadota bacterium]